MRSFLGFLLFALLVFGLLAALFLHVHGKLYSEAAQPCEAAGGVIVLGPNKDWVCVAPIIVKPQHKVLL